MYGDSWPPRLLEEMDPSLFLQYSSNPNGLPQESKLATYMNRNNTTPTRALTQSMNKLSLDSSPNMKKAQCGPMSVGDYMPVNYYAPGNIMPESPENSPPTTLAMPIAQPQVHQENVGGTTYFYSTNDALTTTGPQHVAPMGPPDPGMGAGLGAGMASAISAGMVSAMGAGMGSVMGVGMGSGISAGMASGMGAGMSSGIGAGMSSGIGSMGSGMVSAMGSMGAGMGSAMVPNMASPYASQIYQPTAPTHISPMASKPGLASSFYMPETIRSEIYQRNDDIFLHTDMRQYPDLPENVDMYTNLTPLESAAPHAIATAFRVTHRNSGDYFAIRRLHGHTGTSNKRLELWQQIEHPNVVRLHEVFSSKAFGDHSLILVYEYHPACMTLMNKFLQGGGGTASDSGAAFHDPFSSDPDAPRPYTHKKNAMLRAVASGALLPEAVLWSLLVQLTAALRAIHNLGLACRTLDPTKVIMNGCRVRIAWCGVADTVITNNNDVAQAQQDDMTALGRLALALACRTIHCENLAASMELVSRSYSPDLKNLILYLLSTTSGRRSITDLMPMIGARFYTQVEALQRRADAFEEELTREIDNGRLLRILIKLGVVNERPELNMDSSWSETGDRYMLKLFRDYLFHSVTADGRPWLDQAHITHCLNQLDAGSTARVELMSRDEQSVLVVSYAELKHCMEQAYEEVMQSVSPVP